MLRLPNPCVVVLVGPSASGKSTWAAEWFPAGQIVSADRLRALVGEGEHDQRAGTDAFAVLDLVLERRLRRKLATVVDTLGLDRERRRAYVALARRHGLPVVAVAFDVPDAGCRARNRTRPRPVPSKVLRGHCAGVGRDPAGIEVTHLSLALDASVEEQIGRHRALAEAGVRTAMVRFAKLDEAALEAFAPVIAAFAT